MTESFRAKAWLVDLDGTLYKPAGVKWAMAMEVALVGALHIPVLRSFRQAHEQLREELRADPSIEFTPHPFGEQIARASQATGIPEHVVELKIRSWMVERPGKWLRLFRRGHLLDRIDDYRTGGGKTALVSDYPASTKLQALDAHQLFDSIVASGEHPRLKRLKPTPDGFLLAAEELNVHPSDCLVLGDRPDADGKAAEAAGMKFELIK